MSIDSIDDLHGMLDYEIMAEIEGWKDACQNALNDAATLSNRLAESEARVRALENEAVVLRAAFSHLIWDHECEGYTPSKISLRDDAALRSVEVQS